MRGCLEVKRNHARLWIAAALALAIGLGAVPKRALTPEEVAVIRTQRHLWVSVEELRGAIEEFRRDHKDWPGQPPNGGLDRVASERWFVAHLTMASDSEGRIAPRRETDFPHGPYVGPQALRNSVNGLSSIRVLQAGDPQEQVPDGSTGWIFDPTTGELRMNARGTVPGTEVRYFDL